MNNQNCCLEHFILLLYYIPGKGSSSSLIFSLFFFKEKNKYVNNGALAPSSDHYERGQAPMYLSVQHPAKACLEWRCTSERVQPGAPAGRTDDLELLECT